jgi:hypothetical protein
MKVTDETDRLKIQIGRELLPALRDVVGELGPIIARVTPMQVLLTRPLGLRQRLDVLRAALRLRHTEGMWRVLLFGRTGPMPARPLKFEWHQFDVDLATPGMLPAVIGARVSNLCSTGWTVSHWTNHRWMQSGTYCVRASRRRCWDCDISPSLRTELRNPPCATCSGRGYVLFGERADALEKLIVELETTERGSDR